MSTVSLPIISRIVRRYAPQIIMTGVFSLLIIGVPVLFLFVPWTGFTLPSDVEPVTFKGLDMINYLIDYFMGRNTTFLENRYTLMVVNYFQQNGVSGVLLSLVAHAPFVSVTCLAINAIFSIVLLICGLKAILFGKLSNFRLPSIMAGFLTFFAILSGFGPLLVFGCRSFLLRSLQIDTGLWWIGLVLGGSALIIKIIISLIYDYGLYNHLFVRDRFEEAQLKESIVAPSATIYENAPNRVARPDIEVNNILDRHQKNEHYNIKKEVLLPTHISSIGGHAFANNSELTIANIPNGIPSLGVSAFANCINLKSVSIPNSVKSIGANCFFNCIALSRIYYNDTKQNWSKVTRGTNWLTKSATQVVICSDGAIIVNPYH